MNADSASRWPPTPRPSQLTWTASPPERNGSYRPHPPSPFIISQPESWYSFYCPTEGGRLSRPRHYSNGVQPVPKAAYRSGCRDKHNCRRWDSNLSPLTPQSQSGMLPLDHCDTAMSISSLLLYLSFHVSYVTSAYDARLTLKLFSIHVACLDYFSCVCCCFSRIQLVLCRALKSCGWTATKYPNFLLYVKRHHALLYHVHH